MSLVPMEQGSGLFITFKTELAAAGLPAGDLKADSAQYFALADVTGQAVAFAGMIRLGEEALLRSVLVPAALRPKSYGAWALETIAQWARDVGIRRLWLLTAGVEGFFVGQGFRIVPRQKAPAATAGTTQFSATCPDSAVLMCLTLV